MDPTIATEIAYHNGYDAGYKAGKESLNPMQGTSVNLPCKPGDVVYIIEGNSLRTCKVTGFWIGEQWIQLQLLDGRTFTCWDGIESYLNKTLFVDMELALAEWEKAKND